MISVHKDLNYDPSIEESSIEKPAKQIFRSSNQTDSTKAGSIRSSHRKTNFLKVVIIGDSNVGKTTLIENFQYKKITKIQRPTIGADFMKKVVTLRCGNQVPLQVWDTAG
jgi:GTPase SAR1 family protein